MDQQIVPPKASAKKIRSFIEDSFLYGDAFELGDDASFLEQGILDSTGVLQLVTFLEREFGIAVLDEELTPENLDSLEAIQEFLARKTAA